MAEVVQTTGLVGFVKVGAVPNQSIATLQVLDASTQPPTPELFFIWWEPVDRFVPTGPQWLHRSLQVSLAREALIAGKTVTVSHEMRSAFVSTLQVNQ
jgi:hypothetical protein